MALNDRPRDVAHSIGWEYMENHQSEDSQVVRQAFEAMENVNRELYEDIPVAVQFTPEDPYDDYQDMRISVAESEVLKIFSGGDGHPIWDHEAEVISRAVHDWYGHLTLDVPFTVEGEYWKWDHARTRYPAYCDRVLFTEVVGQLGAAIYLDDGYSDDRFEQKVFPAPPKWIEDMSLAIEREVIGE